MERLDKETYFQMKLMDEAFEALRVNCIKVRKAGEREPEKRDKAVKELQELLEKQDEGKTFKGFKPSDFVDTISPKLVKGYKNYMLEDLGNKITENSVEVNISNFIDKCIMAVCGNIFMNSDVLDHGNARIVVATLIIEDFAKKELISLRDALNLMAYFYFKYSGILDLMHQDLYSLISQKKSSDNPIDDLLGEIEDTLNKQSAKNLL